MLPNSLRPKSLAPWAESLKTKDYRAGEGPSISRFILTSVNAVHGAQVLGPLCVLGLTYSGRIDGDSAGEGGGVGFLTALEVSKSGSFPWLTPQLCRGADPTRFEECAGSKKDGMDRIPGVKLEGLESPRLRHCVL